MSITVELLLCIKKLKKSTIVLLWSSVAIQQNNTIGFGKKEFYFAEIIYVTLYYTNSTVFVCHVNFKKG